MSERVSDQTFIRDEVRRATRALRDRLGISQARLADMIGPELSAITVSRWERGELMPYPKNRQKLAEIAMKNKCWDLATAFDIAVDTDEWNLALKMNCRDEYRLGKLLGLVGFNSSAFAAEDPDNPTGEEIENDRNMRTFISLAEDFLKKLVGLHLSGEAFVVVPPDADDRQLWHEFIERQKRNGETKEATL